MRIVDKPLLALFAAKGSCEWCGYTRHQSPLECHHIFCRGMGGGNRLDIRINLMTLCRLCHQKFHDGNIARADLLAIVARREKVTVDFIESEIYRLRRLPKPIGGSTGAGD